MEEQGEGDEEVYAEAENIRKTALSGGRRGGRRREEGQGEERDEKTKVESPVVRRGGNASLPSKTVWRQATPPGVQSNRTAAAAECGGGEISRIWH
ncbi:hypothetical protein SKAU_G00106550 [Synaphobranchus kaupii]|uniref:Uncharacterized protein n=1 Tax=Synaphobranchus kaupii TaxID=118154 RepID=A0A9Q1G097_SYNKA|nr:hypothetical protein SKAU_G00106550 [Synaphobranchus kaupii]